MDSGPKDQILTWTVWTMAATWVVGEGRQGSAAEAGDGDQPTPSTPSPGKNMAIVQNVGPKTFT